MLGGEEEALVAFLMLSNHTWKGTDVRGGILLSIPSKNYGRMNPLLTKKVKYRLQCFTSCSFTALLTFFFFLHQILLLKTVVVKI